MIRTYFFTLFLGLFLCGEMVSQTTYKAVVNCYGFGYAKGDTVEVLQAYTYQQNGKMWIQLLIKGSFSTMRRIILEKNIAFVSQPESFWAKQYFWKREVLPQYPIQPPTPALDAPFKHGQPRQFKDDILERYLEKMLAEMYTEEERVLFPARPYIKIVEQKEPVSYALSNGCILLSTGLLVQAYTEDELYGILATELAHLIFNHANPVNKYSTKQIFLAEIAAVQLMEFEGRNPKALTYFLDRIRRNYFFLQEELAPKMDPHIMRLSAYYPFLNMRLKNLGFDFRYSLEADAPTPYLDMKMIEVIEYHAFSMNQRKGYVMSLSALNRLIRLEIAEPRHFILKMELIKKIYPDGSHDAVALEQLRFAKELEKGINQRIYEEEVRLLIRLDSVPQAVLILDELDAKIVSDSSQKDFSETTTWSKAMRRRLFRAQKEKEFIQKQDIQTKG